MLFIPLNPVIHYILHKKYYAEVLCKNKDKPMMHCNGKCHLKKELKEQEETSNNPNNPIPVPKTNKEIYPVLLNNQIQLFDFTALAKQDNIPYLTPFIEDIFIDIITPPPEFIS